MIILNYQKKRHKQIISACVLALKQGKVVAYPTDTCYGLAVDAENIKAIRKLYRIKGRDFRKPVHIVVPSVSYARQVVRWNKTASRLAKKFWPGPLTLVLGIGYQVSGKRNYQILSAGTGSLGIRMPDNKIALDLAKVLKQPITTTSANVSGQPDCFSAQEVVRQFTKAKYKPDIVINIGVLPKRKASTVIKINQDSSIQILRKGPVSEKQINNHAS